MKTLEEKLNEKIKCPVTGDELERKDITAQAIKLFEFDPNLQFEYIKFVHSSDEYLKIYLDNEYYGSLYNCIDYQNKLKTNIVNLMAIFKQGLVKTYKIRNRLYRDFAKKEFKDGVRRDGTPISRDEINQGYRVFQCNLCKKMLNYSELMEHYKEHEMTQDEFFKQYQGLQNVKLTCKRCGEEIHFSPISFGSINSTGFGEYCSDKCKRPWKYPKENKEAEENLGTNFWENLCSGKFDKKK